MSDPPPKPDLREPWLVAAWPGMGAVAQLAGSYLVQELGAAPFAEIAPGSYFEARAVDVMDGLVRPAALPRSRFFAWRDPRGRRDLVLFMGEAQPNVHGPRFCEELLGVALELGVTRAVTFAAMASPVHPQAPSRVTAVATDPALLREVQPHGAEVLSQGQITGLNGLLLASAAERGLEGLCLLGEFPFFASSVANPKASAAILSVFRALAGIELDLASLEEQGAQTQGNLLRLLGRLQEAAEAQGATFPISGAPEELPDGPRDGPEEGALDPEQEALVEALFRQAAGDRAVALELKAELDRLGAFERYEDRFLDLFRRAE